MSETIIRRTLKPQSEMTPDELATREQRLRAIDAITDEQIQAGIDADPDAAPICDDEWFSKAKLVESKI
jgi:hypothetical protein